MPDDRAEPSVEAMEAAEPVSIVLLGKFTNRVDIARALDAFAAQAVQRERERLCLLFAGGSTEEMQHMLALAESSEP